METCHGERLFSLSRGRTWGSEVVLCAQRLTGSKWPTCTRFLHLEEAISSLVCIQTWIGFYLKAPLGEVWGTLGPLEWGKGREIVCEAQLRSHYIRQDHVSFIPAP